MDYQSRHHELNFVLSPYYSSANLTFAAAQSTLQLTYEKTVLHVERNNTKTTGLDALAVRAAQKGYEFDAAKDPEMPIASIQEPHLTIDAEGLVWNSDGT